MRKLKSVGTICLVMSLLVVVSAGCGKNDEGMLVPGASVQSIVEGVRTGMGKNYVRMPVAMQEDALSTLLGLNPEHVEEFAGDFSMTMTSADSFIAIRAKEGYGDEVRTALERRQTEVERSFQQYLPEALKIAKAGNVLQKGDYVFLIMLGDSKGEPDQDVAAAEKIISNYFELGGAPS